MSDDLSQRVSNLEDKVTDIQVRQAEIHGAVHHIKGRIDNGMGATISDISKKLDAYVALCSVERAEIKSKIKDHSSWFDAIKNFLVWFLGIAITAGVVAFGMFAFKANIHG